MNKGIKIALVLALFGVLILVRAFEQSLFYDPLLLFFQVDHSTEPLPEFDTFMLLWNIGLRFLINTAVSLLILWVLFRRKEIIKISALLYLGFFIILFVAFLILLQSSGTGGHMGLFYARRFLIQPLLLLLLIPAFYFQRKP